MKNLSYRVFISVCHEQNYMLFRPFVHPGADFDKVEQPNALI